MVVKELDGDVAIREEIDVLVKLAGGNGAGAGLSIVFYIFFKAERGSKEESAPLRPGSRRPGMFFVGGRYRRRKADGQNYCATRWGSECDAPCPRLRVTTIFHRDS